MKTKLIDGLNGSVGKHRSIETWVDGASKKTNLKSSYIKQKLWLAGNIFDQIPHRDKGLLLKNIKVIRFRSNSDIHKGKKSWNSGLGLRNGKPKCNTGSKINNQTANNTINRYVAKCKF